MNDKTKEEIFNKARELAEGFGLMRKIRGTTLKVLKMSKSRRKSFFEKISFSKPESLPGNLESILTKENILSYIDRNEFKMTFTLKCLIMLEYKLTFSDVSTLRMLDDLNAEYYTNVFKATEYPLKGEEKAIIITLLGLMSFSPESSLKLSSHKDEHSNVEDFRSCVNQSIEFLRFMGQEYIDNTLDRIWDSNVRGEDPVNAKMARIDDIVLKTNNTYQKAQRKEGHFLDILKDDQINSEKLTFLLEKLFDKGPPTFEQREKFIDLLKQLSSERHRFRTNISGFEILTIFYTMCDIVRKFT